VQLVAAYKKTEVKLLGGSCQPTNLCGATDWALEPRLAGNAATSPGESSKPVGVDGLSAVLAQPIRTFLDTDKGVRHVLEV